MEKNLVYYGNKTLREIAGEILNIDQQLIDLIDTMYNIMYSAKGVGLAAPQVNISKRIIVVDVEAYKGPVITLINPKITGSSNETVPYEEGCLSIPGISADVIRPKAVSIKGISPDGKEVQFEADGILARVLQHEVDHLNGVLFIDHIEEYMKKEFTPELKKIKKLNH